MPSSRRTPHLIGAAFALALTAVAPAAAQPLVYQPKNPAFGGFASNYSWLMQSAEAQKDPVTSNTSSFFRDPLADFQQSLQRQILSQLSRELILNRFGNLDLEQGGRYDLGDYIIEIVPGLESIAVKIFNVLTGDDSVVTIPRF